MPCNSSFAVATAEASPIRFRSGERLGSVLSYPSPSVGSLKIISSDVIEIGWDSIMLEPCFVEYPAGQCPATLAKCAPNNDGKQRHQIYGTQRMDLRESLQQYSPNLISEMLSKSALNCTMQVFSATNVCIVTCRPISRQRPKYAHATIEKVLEEVFSMWSASCPVLGNRPIITHSDNRRGVSTWSAPCQVLNNGPMDTHFDT
jgi:hypothetical protein